MQDVAVAHNVVLALEPELARLARASFALAGDVIFIADRLGPDEALLEVGMDDAGRLRRPRALFDRPGARLLRPDREEGHEMQQAVPRTDDAVEARLGK